MVTGDRADAAETIGAALDLDAVLSDRVPSDKVEAVATEQRLNPTLMVGDGINDAPALAAADVGIAMGARGASASSEAADVVILVDQLERVSDAVVIAKRRTRASPCKASSSEWRFPAWPWRLLPSAGYPRRRSAHPGRIDVAVILNALRALSPVAWGPTPMPRRQLGIATRIIEELEASLTGCARSPMRWTMPIGGDGCGIYCRSQSHRRQGDRRARTRGRELRLSSAIEFLLRQQWPLRDEPRTSRDPVIWRGFLARLSDGLRPDETDRYMIRDAQRIIESIECLVRIHNAQEEDIYETAVANWGGEVRPVEAGKPGAISGRGAAAPGPASQSAPKSSLGWRMPAGALVILAFAGGWFTWSLHRGHRRSLRHAESRTRIQSSAPCPRPAQ